MLNKNFFANTLFLFLIVCVCSCSPKVRPNYTSEVNFIYKENNEVFVVSSIGYGSNKTDATVNAQKSAFTVVLFRGVPGSDLNVPLIDNENEARSKHSNYFKKFFDEGKYKSFMLLSEEMSDVTSESGQKKIKLKIKINHNSLRKDLETNQIIRKFGF